MSWKVKITTEKGSLILPTYRTKREAEEAAEAELLAAEQAAM